VSPVRALPVTFASGRCSATWSRMTPSPLRQVVVLASRPRGVSLLCQLVCQERALLQITSVSDSVTEQHARMLQPVCPGAQQLGQRSTRASRAQSAVGARAPLVCRSTSLLFGCRSTACCAVAPLAAGSGSHGPRPAPRQASHVPSLRHPSSYDSTARPRTMTLCRSHSALDNARVQSRPRTPRRAVVSAATRSGVPPRWDGRRSSPARLSTRAQANRAVARLSRRRQSLDARAIRTLTRQVLAGRGTAGLGELWLR
jgi:hypothetical protein